MADDNTEFHELARTHVHKRRNFFALLVSYVIINSLLIGIWAMSGGGYFWPAWVLLGWGVGVAFTAWDVFFRRPVTEEDVQREMKRMRPEDS